MGIDASLVYQLGTTVRAFGVRGALCTLGQQTVRSDDTWIAQSLAAAGLSGRTGESLYAQLGFDRVASIDVSDFEGCTHIFDLNTPGLPASLVDQFDAVYNGGTLEHVFDTRTALRNVFDLLKTGGVAIHVGPANGWLDHGFYQFSPTLLIDYYFANRFEILEASLIQLIDDQPDCVVVHPYVPDAALDTTSLTGRWLFYMTFRKGASSTWEAIPQQRYYTAMYGAKTDLSRTPLLRYAPPYRLQGGVPVMERAEVQILPTPVRCEGFEWMVHVPEIAAHSDTMERRSSPVVLFEDGVAIGPPHALHTDIRTLGAGRYSHWEEWLRFSPTRNDDAREHVYTYAMASHGL